MWASSSWLKNQSKILAPLAFGITLALNGTSCGSALNQQKQKSNAAIAVVSRPSGSWKLVDAFQLVDQKWDENHQLKNLIKDLGGEFILEIQDSEGKLNLKDFSYSLQVHYCGCGAKPHIWLNFTDPNAVEAEAGEDPSKRVHGRQPELVALLNNIFHDGFLYTFQGQDCIFETFRPNLSGEIPKKREHKVADGSGSAISKLKFKKVE